MWAVTHFEKACVATWANIWMMVYFSKRIDWEWLYFHVFVWHRRRLCFKTKSQNILLKHCLAFQRHWWGKCLILGFNLGFDKNHFKASWEDEQKIHSDLIWIALLINLHVVQYVYHVLPFILHEVQQSPVVKLNMSTGPLIGSDSFRVWLSLKR